MAPSNKKVPLPEDFKEAYGRNPGMIDDTLRAIAKDPVSAEPKTDYITDLKLRRELFAEIQIFLRGNSHVPPINCAALAVLMVAPIEHLREAWNERKADENCGAKMEQWIRTLIEYPPAAIKDCMSYLS